LFGFIFNLSYLYVDLHLQVVMSLIAERLKHYFFFSKFFLAPCHSAVVFIDSGICFQLIGTE